MRLSTLNVIKGKTTMIDVFAGYNHNIRISESEFYDMKNMSSQHFPVLSPRAPRGCVEWPSDDDTHVCNGLIDKDGLCYVDGTKLFVGGQEVQNLTLTDSRKQLVSMGAYIIIMPDKVYVNTKDLSDKGSIEKSYTSSGTVTYELTKPDGSAYGTAPTVSPTEPENPSNMDMWIDTSSTPHVLKQYSSTSAMWTAVVTTYVKIKASGIAHGFSLYDGVTISGITPPQLQTLEGQTSILYGCYRDDATEGANDYVIVVGIIDEATTQSAPLTLTRKMPAMDFLIESENRLWGCRYGLNNDGDVVNEIYASKLGDFRNWNCFMGISTDSYAASCGTDGPFTGAVTHLGYPTFWKENCMHKVFGSMPSNYQMQTTACRGVQKGAGESLVIINSKLYYKSANGICVYDGSLPVEVSASLGNIRYTALDENDADLLRNGAHAGGVQNLYYISMRSEADGKWHMFVFDTSRGLWIREDNMHADAFCTSGGELYFSNHDTGRIMTALGSGDAYEGKVEWMTETGMLSAFPQRASERNLEKKYVSKLGVRMRLEYASRVMVYIQYDSCGEWEHVATIERNNTNAFELPLRPKRCDHFRLRLEGAGDAAILAITKTVESGGDT